MLIGGIVAYTRSSLFVMGWNASLLMGKQVPQPHGRAGRDAQRPERRLDAYFA